MSHELNWYFNNIFILHVINIHTTLTFKFYKHPRRSQNEIDVFINS